jgi:hypothetical protein
MAYLSTHLQLNFRHFSVDLKVQQKLLQHADVRTNDERLHPGSQRTEAASPFLRTTDGARLEVGAK